MLRSKITEREKLKVIAVDLDDTLCTRPKDVEHLKARKYDYCTPIPEMIKVVNELYPTYRIIVYTARGMLTFDRDQNKIYEKLYTLTYEQLLEWGLKFDQLIMGKLHYDIMIDDKVINTLNIKSATDVKEALNDQIYNLSRRQ